MSLAGGKNWNKLEKVRAPFSHKEVGNAGHTKHADFFLSAHTCMSVFARVLRTHWSEQECWNDGGVDNGGGSAERRGPLAGQLSSLLHDL